MGRGIRVGGCGKKRFTMLPANQPLPPILRDGVGDSDGAICIDDAQFILDESFWQRCNINIVQASPMASHLITIMQRLITA